LAGGKANKTVISISFQTKVTWNKPEATNGHEAIYLKLLFLHKSSTVWQWKKAATNHLLV